MILGLYQSICFYMSAQILFSFKTVNVWNFLHNDIVDCETAHGFSVKLKSLELFFSVKLKSLELTRFFKGQVVWPN